MIKTQECDEEGGMVITMNKEKTNRMELEPGEIEPGEIKAGEIKTERIEPGQIKVEQIKSENTKTENTKTGKELEAYLSNGVANIVKGMISASFMNPKASLFMAKYAINSKKAREKRKDFEQKGEHIPPFLIASITEQCNLHCKGCYARANHSCKDSGASEEKNRTLIVEEKNRVLTAEQWNKIFTEAEGLGIEFILLAGGEPFVRRDVLEQAGKHQNMIFPIFTNGTMIDSSYERLLQERRNLMPVFSIEGNQDTTDSRRGEGIYQLLEKTMQSLHKKGLLFGASVTVTTENMQEVFSEKFMKALKQNGAKAVIYVEYVPVDDKTKHLALEDSDRKDMMKQLNELRAKEKEMVFIAFPGDEKSSGGCLAAGRGFFHINARGGAEPCPFSPYSDTSLSTHSLKEALQSKLFRRLQENGNLVEEHIGGCVLFEQKEQVAKMLEMQV